MPAHVSEQQLETDVVDALTTAGGYTLGANGHYDVDQGFDTAELLAFLGATQGERWEELKVRHGGDPDEAQVRFCCGWSTSWIVEARSTCCARASTTRACTSTWPTSGPRTPRTPS